MEWNKGSALIIPFRLRSSASPSVLPYLTRRQKCVIAPVDHQQSEHCDEEVDLEHMHWTEQGFSIL